MAVVRLGSVVSDISGSIGDETYGRNQGGIFVRERVTPNDPNTGHQINCRNAMKILAQAWSGTLSEQQRKDWHAYAHQHPQPDKWGTPTLTNGYTRFVQVNFQYQRLHAAILTPDAPTAPPLWPPIFTFTANATHDDFTIALPLPTYDPAWTGLRVYVYGGFATSPGINFYNGPWQIIMDNPYNGSWQADPFGDDYTIAFDPGDKVWLKIRIQDDTTGALSVPFQTSTIAGA